METDLARSMKDLASGLLIATPSGHRETITKVEQDSQKFFLFFEATVAFTFSPSQFSSKILFLRKKIHTQNHFHAYVHIHMYI
jgi:hypothetical protein